MAITAADTVLIGFTLPSTPCSVKIARLYIRAALTYHQLGDYTEVAETVASELVTNAIEHAEALTFSVELTQQVNSGAVAVVVSDASRCPPVRCLPSEASEHGRGLNIVDALSAHWGWRPRAAGKAVYAILAREA
ncbi:MAG TPA: ATP-binding protein [Trebonia sp.]